MLELSSPLTLFLAKAIGAYMIFAGLSGLTAADRWERLLQELRDSAGLSYLTGLIVFTFGSIIVYSHNIWDDSLTILISLIGWGALIEGALLIAIPQRFLKFSISLIRPVHYKSFAIFAIILGLALSAAGFTGTVR